MFSEAHVNQIKIEEERPAAKKQTIFNLALQKKYSFVTAKNLGQSKVKTT